MRELAREHGLKFRMAVIGRNIRPTSSGAWRKRRSKAWGREELTETRWTCGPIVAQMGTEPFIRALDAGASSDRRQGLRRSIFARCPSCGFDKGAVPALRQDTRMRQGCPAIPDFDGTAAWAACARSFRGRGRATRPPLHQLYRSRAIRFTSAATLVCSRVPRQQRSTDANSLSSIPDGSSVRQPFRAGWTYRVKLEGGQVGFSIVIVGIRDPIMIRQIDSILDAAPTRRGTFSRRRASILSRIYGKNAVMGERSPTRI